MPRNPLKEENPQQEIKGEHITNVHSQKAVRISDQNGNTQDIIIGYHITHPDKDGRFIDSELINVVTDYAGNPLPEEPRSVIRSHSGLYISSPEQLAHCTSFLHFSPSRSRNIFLGQDGRATPNGAICSRCEFWLNSISIVLGIFVIGMVIGLFKGTGLF